MNRLMQTFIDELYAADSEQDLKGALTTAAEALDLPRFVYLGISKRVMGGPLVITTYPGAWEHRYLGRAYQRIDPVVTQAFSSHAPFHWGTADTLRGLTKRQLQIFDEAAMFGLRCGFTVPIHDEIGRMSAVTFASPEKPEVFQGSLKTNEDLLHLMAVHFHVHARQKLGFGASSAWPRLSPRETQCLQWAAHGKTRWEISRILRVSPRTVAFHIDNARAKLDATSTTEAVAKAVREHLITLT
jgi:DNA-binding CsgD family transcriptional regulator